VRPAVVVAVAAGVAALAGCAVPGYDASKLQGELRRAGLTAAQAKCVTDGMEAKFDLREMASHSDPTSEQLAKAHDVLVACKVNLSKR
jgi:hypothetical protein